MQAYFGERAHFDQASAILDSNSKEAWEERKGVEREKGEWEFNWTAGQASGGLIHYIMFSNVFGLMSA